MSEHDDSDYEDFSDDNQSDVTMQDRGSVMSLQELGIDRVTTLDYMINTYEDSEDKKQAAFMLGAMLIEQDPEKGIPWLLKAVELGNESALYLLGTCYDEGLGVAMDKKKAFESYLKGKN